MSCQVNDQLEVTVYFTTMVTTSEKFCHNEVLRFYNKELQMDAISIIIRFYLKIIPETLCIIFNKGIKSFTKAKNVQNYA